MRTMKDKPKRTMATARISVVNKLSQTDVAAQATATEKPKTPAMRIGTRKAKAILQMAGAEIDEATGLVLRNKRVIRKELPVASSGPGPAPVVTRRSAIYGRLAGREKREKRDHPDPPEEKKDGPDPPEEMDGNKKNGKPEAPPLEEDLPEENVAPEGTKAEDQDSPGTTWTRTRTRLVGRLPRE